MTNLSHDGSVEFRFFRAGARHVSLVGDFNQWAEQLPMRRDGGEGWWVAELKLAPGDYRFRYVADGTWYTDFASNGVEATKTGWNSMLVVPASNADRPSRFEGDIQVRAKDATALKVA
jgi:1,4-alpha-glucan branching enzyme